MREFWVSGYFNPRQDSWKKYVLKGKKTQVMKQSRHMLHLVDIAEKNKHLPFISPHLTTHLFYSMAKWKPHCYYAIAII